MMTRSIVENGPTAGLPVFATVCLVWRKADHAIKVSNIQSRAEKQ